MALQYFFRRYFGLHAIPMLIIVPGKKLTWPATAQNKVSERVVVLNINAILGILK